MHDRKLIIPELLAEVIQLVVVLAIVVDKKKTTHGIPLRLESGSDHVHYPTDLSLLCDLTPCPVRECT